MTNRGASEVQHGRERLVDLAFADVAPVIEN